MAKHTRTQTGNAHTRLQNPSAKFFSSLTNNNGCIHHINAMVSNALQTLGDPKDLDKTWKSISKSAMQLLGFERRPVNFTLSNSKPSQGETLALMVQVPPPENFIDNLNLSFRGAFCKDSMVQVTLGDEKFPAYFTSGSPNTWRTLIPLTPLDPGGQCSLTVDIKDGRHNSFSGIIEVMEKDYPIESLWLSEDKSTIHATQQELDEVKVLVSNKTAKQYWHGPFRLPTHGEVTTEYGIRRYYNGVFASRYYHRGIDYGAPHGELVGSPAAGHVFMVGREDEGFPLHGNCIGLDHGHGVTSILMHLNSILVEKGTVVQAGDLLGTVGDTGLATGPHLHWGLYVHGKAVDQSHWMREQIWIQ